MRHKRSIASMCVSFRYFRKKKNSRRIQISFCVVEDLKSHQKTHFDYMYMYFYMCFCCITYTTVYVFRAIIILVFEKRVCVIFVCVRKCLFVCSFLDVFQFCVFFSPYFHCLFSLFLILILLFFP